MAFDLTMSNAAYGTGKFGQSLSSGKGYVSGLFATGDTFTISAYGLFSGFAATAAICVLCGQAGMGYMGIWSDGTAFARYGATPETTINTTININDGQRHLLELNFGATGGALFLVDGVVAGSSTVATTFNRTANAFVIRQIQVGGATFGSDWRGDADEVCVYGVRKHTAAYTPPTTATPNNDAGLIAVYHLDGNGLNSLAVADTTKPTALSAAVGSATPTTVAISMSEPLDPAFVPAPSTVTISGHTVTALVVSGSALNVTVDAFVAGEAARTASYTPNGTNNLRDMSGNQLDAFSGLAIANNAAATDTAPPVFASAQVANASPNVIQVTMSETLANSVPPASAFTASGGRSVTGVAISGAIASVTVNTAYANTDTVTIAYTQPTGNPRLQDAAGNPTASFTAQPVTNNVAAAAVPNAFDVTKILFSPYNWDVQSGYAKTINAGAYFKTCFGGATCTLNFDMTGIANPVPKLVYRVDETGPWVTVDLAASIVISMPADTATYPSHFLEVMVRSTSEVNSRWVSQATATKLIGVVLATGKTLSLPPAQPRFGLYYGDSITEGINTLKNTGDATVRSDAGQGWAYLSAKMIGAEAGIVGFGRQGFISTGNPDVPVFQNTWNLLYKDVPRSFTRAPDYIVINQGTNDNGGNIQVAATAVLNNLLAATPASTKIIVLRPFNGSSNAFWAAAVSGSADPSRITHVDTTGWFNTTNSPDALHPNGFENVSHIAPLMAAKLREVLGTGGSTAPAPVTGTSSFTTDAMINSGTIRAGQACQWTWFAGGSVGSAAGSPVHGSGTLTAQGKLTATGLPSGVGYIMARFADGGRYYQEGVAA